MANKIYFRTSDNKYISLEKKITHEDMEKAKPTKYIKRVPKPSGKGYIYFYTREQVKDFQEKGKLPEEKKGEAKSVWQKLSSFFGGDSKSKVEKLKETLFRNDPVTTDVIAEHLAEYIANKDKWDARFQPKEKGERKESSEKKEPPKPVDKKEKTPSRFNVSIMRKIADQFGMIGALKDKQSEVIPASEFEDKKSPDNFETMPEGKDKYKKIASHKDWVSGATITESRKKNGDTRFTATIEGWRNFKIYEGKPSDEISKKVQEKVREIRDRLKSGDESILNENTSIETKPSAVEALKDELGKKKGGGAEELKSSQNNSTFSDQGELLDEKTGKVFEVFNETMANLIIKKYKQQGIELESKRDRTGNYSFKKKSKTLEKALSSLREELMLKAQPTKYIKKIPNPKGKGYIYFYTQDQVKDYEKSGKLPDDKDKKDPAQQQQGGDKKQVLKDALKKIATIFSDALSGKDTVQPAGSGVEQVGESIAAKSKEKKRLEENKKKVESKPKS